MSSNESYLEEAFDGIVKAICKHCLDRGIAGRDQIQDMIDHYKRKLTVDLIQEEISTNNSFPPNKRSRCGSDLNCKPLKRVQYCTVEGCTGKVIRGRTICKACGGVAEKTLRKCSFQGCTTYAHVDGLCFQHGGRLVKGKRHTKGYCRHEGCTNNVQKNGVCVRHGAKRKLCTFEGCTNQAQNGGRCKRHGAKVKACTYEGCTKQVERGGFCVRHGTAAGIRHGTRIKDCKENSDDGSRKGGERSMINIEAGNVYAGKDMENGEGAEKKEEKDSNNHEVLIA